MKKMQQCARSLLYAVLCAAILAGLPAHAASSTLQEVRDRGHLVCGVSEGLTGFSIRNDEGDWSGFDVDFCRAVAAAIFGASDKVKFVALSATARFEALRDGDIDLLSRNTTWTLSREIGLDLDFAGVSYYDGQGFMTRAENGLTSALQLAAARVCVLKGTTSLSNARAYFERNRIPVELIEFERREDALKAYAGRECDVYSADKSALASQRSALEDESTHILLPEVISKEPLGPAVRKDDPGWTGVVRWVLFLLINAEEAGWTAAQAREGDSQTGVAVAVPEEVSEKLGLPRDWARHVIAAVGNYQEIFERNVGEYSPLGLGRGINALWTNGGILYAPPLR